MNKSTTQKLEEALLNIDNEASLEKYLKTTPSQHPAMSFADYFQSVVTAAGREKSEICESSGIERSYFYHILSGSKTPGRDKILRMCIAAGMNEEETNTALKCGNEAVLYARNMHDAVIIFVLHQHLSVTDANELLDSYHLPLLS